jgi:hypothetical protein
MRLFGLIRCPKRPPSPREDILAEPKEGEHSTHARKREAALHTDAEMRDHADAEDRAFEEAVDEWKGRHLRDGHAEDSEVQDDASGRDGRCGVRRPASASRAEDGLSGDGQ